MKFDRLSCFNRRSSFQTHKFLIPPRRIFRVDNLRWHKLCVSVRAVFLCLTFPGDTMKRLISLFPIFLAALFCVSGYAEFPYQFLFGHTGRALAVAFSLNGRWLASGSANEILVWEVGADEPTYTLTGHTGKIQDLTFRSNGDLASASVDGTVRLWDVSTQQEIRAFEGHVGQVTSVDFNPNGTHIISGSRDRTLKLWGADTSELLGTFEGHTDVVWSVAFSPDGSLIVSGSEDGTVRLWDASDGSQLHSLTGHTQGVLSVAFHPDGDRIASGARDGTVQLWNINPADPGAAIEEPEPFATYDRQVMSVLFNPNGRILAVGLLDSLTDNTLKLWDVFTRSELQFFDTQIVHDLSFSPTRPQLAVAGSAAGTITIWNSSHLRPVLLEPQGGEFVKPSQINLKWETVENAVYYDVQISSDSSFTTANTQFITTTVNELFFEAENNISHYWWRVRTGSFSRVSDWSEVRDFRAPGCVVRIVPSVRRVNLGEEFAVDVFVESVIDLQGFGFDLRWTNPNVLTFVTVTKFRNVFGEAGIGHQPTEPPDQINGIYKDISAAKTGASGVTGSGIMLGASFRAKAAGLSRIQLQNLILVDSNQKQIDCEIHEFKVMVEELVRPWDVNIDGVVNIFDLSTVVRYLGQPIPTDLDIYPDVNGDSVIDFNDVMLVSSHFGESYQTNEIPAAPQSAGVSLHLVSPTIRKQLESIYRELLLAPKNSPEFIRTIQVLQHLLFPLFPAYNQLLQNYPNPFNPETWIPFQITSPGQVTIEIYDAAGALVRRIGLGHLMPGRYLNRVKAAYWDGKNVYGESVASGIYFYTLSTASFRATRKMIISK